MQRDLLELTLTTLDDMKANAVNNMNIAKLTSVSDFMIFSTGNSSKHVRSIANKIAENVKKEGHSIIGIEGYERSQWVLIDLGNIIVHIMLAETREFYKLEDLWSQDFREEAP
jgi:ribosome-associated protein